MTIYQTDHYQIKAEAVDRVTTAISEFVTYVSNSEPSMPMSVAWQSNDDPIKFVHLFEFADEASHRLHGSSDAVRQFESVYGPELIGGPVVVTDYLLVATNGGRWA